MSERQIIPPAPHPEPRSRDSILREIALAWRKTWAADLPDEEPFPPASLPPPPTDRLLDNIAAAWLLARSFDARRDAVADS